MARLEERGAKKEEIKGRKHSCRNKQYFAQKLIQRAFRYEGQKKMGKNIGKKIRKELLP